jgi:hypothetical protein
MGVKKCFQFAIRESRISTKVNTLSGTDQRSGFKDAGLKGSFGFFA